MAPMYVNVPKPGSPWRVALEQAWAAYAAGTVPVGAAIADVHGVVVAQGRNRIWDEPAPGQIGRTRLAHAEVNAILALSAESFDPRALTLFTTAEPCPLCVGAILMANIRALRYASREPFAGSVAMLRATPYVRSKEVSVHGPNDSQLEGFLIAIATEFHLRAAGPRVAELVALSAVVRPDAVALGERLYRSGEWQALRTKRLEEVFSLLVQTVDSSLQGV
ncbi:MAG: nucleoside deaminase [Chloroflexi bacterium]|nr:MAG: nucleoside deaminase [Chloroflexota bacterium]